MKVMTEFDFNNDLLIIPDVHGRDFWRGAVDRLQWSHVLFLGDYTDPYPHEGISVEETYENLCDILSFAHGHEEKVTLLVGNHDMHYISRIFADLAMGSRYCRQMADCYRALFETHASLFSLAFEAEFEGERCLFTHAGVVPEWYQQHSRLVGELNAGNLNRLLENEEGQRALADVGWMRGGPCLAGGPLWADCREMEGLDSGPYQIFGHTQSWEGIPVITPGYACVDTRSAYLLSKVLDMR